MVNITCETTVCVTWKSSVSRSLGMSAVNDPSMYYKRIRYIHMFMVNITCETTVWVTWNSSVSRSRGMSAVNDPSMYTIRFVLIHP